MQGALITVMVPVWNGAAYLARTLESIRAQRDEFGEALEVIVADDGSSDASADIAAAFTCRLLRLKHGGIARTCNAALAEASGDALLFLDQDDLLLGGALGILWQALQQAGAGAVTGMALDFLSPELTPEQCARLRLRGGPYYGLLTGCTLVRSAVAREVGPFNEEYTAGQAVDWLLRLQDKTECRRLNVVTARRRIHTSNTSRLQRTGQWQDYGNILRSRCRAKGNEHA